MKIKVGLVDDHQLFLKSLSLMLEALDDFDVVLEAFKRP
jgi:DNA-binding NarL/FixJ family response regulator